MTKPEPKKAEWPKLARGPQGNTATFQCRGDVPAGWVVLGEEVVALAPKKPFVMDVADTRGSERIVTPDNLAAARADYLAAFGKRPGPKWDAATIRQKLAEKA